MKKPFWSYYLFFSFLVLIICSCQKPIDVSQQAKIIQPQSKARLSDEERSAKLDLIKDQLTVIGMKLTWIFKNPKAKEVLYQEVVKQFDDDYNVLISTLIEQYNAKGINAENEISKINVPSNLNTDFHKSIDLFKSNYFKLDGDETYPQLFIPFYEELVKSGKLGKATPIIVINQGDEKNVTRVGYSVDDKNQVVTITNIDEDFAKKNEIWVISINERARSQERLNSLAEEKKRKKGARAYYVYPNNGGSVYFTLCSDLSNGTAPDFGDLKGLDLSITHLNINIHNESWFNGKSEIGIIGTTAWGNGHVQSRPYDQINNTSTIDTAPKGSIDQLLLDVPRSDVGQSYYLTVPNPNLYTLNGGVGWGGRAWNYNTSQWYERGLGDCFYYAIYEYDGGSWASDAFILSPSWDVNDQSTNSVTLDIESNDPEYIRGYVYWYQFANGCVTSLGNNDIKFMMKAETVQHEIID